MKRNHNWILDTREFSFIIFKSTIKEKKTHPNPRSLSTHNVPVGVM
jgi:hypothetical protein